MTVGVAKEIEDDVEEVGKAKVRLETVRIGYFLQVNALRHLMAIHDKSRDGEIPDQTARGTIKECPSSLARILSAFYSESTI